MSERDRELSAEEAAAYLGVSRRTFERYAREGKFRKFEQFAPRRYYYLQSDLDALKQGRQVVRPEVRLPVMMEHFDRYLEEQGHAPQSEFVRTPALEPVPEDMAIWLGVPTGTLAPHRILLQSVRVQGQRFPFRLSDNFYNPTLVQGALFEQMQRDPRFDTMRALKEQQAKVPVRGRWEVVARSVTDEQLQLLQVVRGTPILQILGANYAEDGTVVFVNLRSFVGDMAKVDIEAPINFWR